MNKKWAKLLSEVTQEDMQKAVNKLCYPADHAEKRKAYYDANKERFAERGRTYRYGMTSEQYRELDRRQEGRCAICKTPFAGIGKKHRHVDHDHATGQVRGLLCGSCNQGIGYFKENVEALRAAIAYLQSPPLEPACGDEAGSSAVPPLL